ncbi:MAG: S8 family serine peptidase [Planctomycetes bacterium]|nr:S8 family serine peptidase [Planctomycetota bacterium]
MTSRTRRSSLLRQTRFESFEERLALSAQPVADFYLTSQVEQRIETHLEQIEQHLGELQELESGQSGEITHHTGEIEQHLADVHDTTGVSYVHNTYGLTGAGQTVAVIDSGIAWDHLALGAGLGTGYRVVGGWDFAENDADPYDDGPSGFHGTHVAGIIGSDNSTYQGVASDVDLVGLRVFDDDGAGYFSWVEDALQWVHDHRNDFANPITTVNMSLGTDWNSDSIPSWTTIEDELSQLEQDGIFIAVSAGNSFAEYNTPGLSYPAASPYVVPVSSITNDGIFSSFSQRHDRVVAAPGNSITSTVPDYVFGADGSPNDFGTASGTSMASPYVAGASVLVRQAMEFVGIQNITQDTIYDHIRSTADIFYDATTSASYHRLNVQAALDGLMPVDDYGSVAIDAHDLGILSGENTFNGLIGTTEDQDVFTFTAGATGSISFTTDTTFSLVLDAQLIDGEGSFENNVLTFDVVAGNSYTLSLASSEGIGYYSTAISLDEAFSPIDAGTIELTQLTNQKVSGEAWYAIKSSRSGLLTVEAFFERGNGEITLEAYSSDMQLLGASDSLVESERLDTQVSSSTTYYICVIGTNDEFNLRLANLVSSTNEAFDVFGTDSDDSITLDLESSSITVNGVAYSVGASTINIDTQGGVDSLTILGTDANETVVFHSDSVEVGNGTTTVLATGVEVGDVYGRGGAGDRAHFHDSVGNDSFYGRENTAQMVGVGFAHTAHGFDYNYAYASLGAGDRAYFYDSAGNDEFVARPNWVRMSGAGFSHYANGFDYSYAYADHGAGDRAYFYDSGGSDEFVARPNWVRMNGPGFSNYANGFDYNYAYADYGTNDRAYFYDSGGSDEFVARPNWVRMTGAGFFNYANGFDKNYAYANYGTGDRAYFYDSAGNDEYVTTSQWTQMFGVGFFNEARGFEYNFAYAEAGGSADHAYFYRASTDEFSAGLDWSQLLGNGQLRFGQGFENTQVYEELEVESKRLSANGNIATEAGLEIASVDHLFNQFGE